MGKIIEGYYIDDTWDMDYQLEQQLPADAKFIGKRRLPRKDGYAKAGGTAKYARDISLPGMLYAKMMVTPYAHARIKSMDTSKAEALPGVRGILRYDDPENPPLVYSFGVFGGLKPLTGHPICWNQPVGLALAAESEEICDEALKLVEIEWEELPVEIDWDELVKDNIILEPELTGDTNIVVDLVDEIGDVEAGFAEADHQLEWQVDRQENTCLCVEPWSGVFEWRGDHLHMWFTGQFPNSIKYYCFSIPWLFPASDTFGPVPISKQHYHGSYMGLQSTGTAIAWSYTGFRIPAILAKRLGRPVKIFLDKSSFIGHDHDTGSYRFKVGFNDDGTITAVNVDTIQVRPWLGGFVNKDLHHQTSIKNLRAHKVWGNDSRKLVHCYRDGGDLQIVTNSVYTRVAAALEKDPAEIALKNVGAEGESWEELQEYRNEHFLQPNRHSLQECIDIAKVAIDWDNKWHAPGTKKLANGRYHGLSFQWSHEWSNYKGHCYVGLTIQRDGTVNILGEKTAFGIGAETTYSQVVADELGVNYEDVEQNGLSFDTPYYFWESGGSVGMTATTPGLVRVAHKAKRMLLELACRLKPVGVHPPVPPSPSDFPDKKPEDLDVKDGFIFEKANPDNKKTVGQVVSGHYGQRESVMVDDFTGSISGRINSCMQVQIIEVEVDPDTGKVYITKVVCVNDVGKAINYDIVEGQQYGGAYMGLGASNQEEVYYDKATAIQLNDNFEGYKVALMNDIGPVDCNIVETGQGYGAYGVCGVGEDIGAVTYSATHSAIYNAIGKWVDEMPTTPDRVLKALGKI